jgi:hypothetical protein
MANIMRAVKQSDPEAYAIDPAIQHDEGNFVKWDAGTSLLVAQAAGDARPCQGVLMDANPVASLPFGTASSKNRVLVSSGKFANDIYRMKTTFGDTYAHLDTLEVGADSQTVVKGATANNLVAIAWLPDGTTVTGGPGAEVTIKIKPQGV